MYITEIELMKQKLEAVHKGNESELIKAIIADDMNSSIKKEMMEGEKYYCCQHDVLQKNFSVKHFSETYQTPEGKQEERMKLLSNPNRSNHHVVCPFHHVLVEQKVSYLVAKEPSILVKGENDAHTQKYEKLLSELADEKFNGVLYEWIVGASNKGVEYVHVYYDKNGKLQYCVVPAEELIVFYDSVNKTEIEQVIRYYYFNIVENGKEQAVKKVEWWTKNDVTYYIEKSDGSYQKEQNPTGHWTIIKENMEEIEKEQHGWGKVPFIALRNNSKELSDLKMIKGLIDAYDLICSEGTNSLLDLVDLYWVIAGYGGETASAIAKKLQVNRAVQISDSSGKVETKQVHLPIEGRIQWLKLLRKDIFHFGMGVDTDSENLGNAPSGVSLKFQYAMFNLKINGIVPEIKKSLKQLFCFLLEDCNRKNDTDYNVNSIDIKLNLNSITDDMEMVNMITASKGIVSEKTLLAQHPFVQDVNSEIQAVWQEKERVINYDTDEQTGQAGNHKSTAVSAKDDGMES
ncbi:MAG: phage portal protein [Firmicutes bacterium]|jgi:SPP1 family phage portal protein|nr:phage portal protein [Bacillota bacterium]